MFIQLFQVQSVSKMSILVQNSVQNVQNEVDFAILKLKQMLQKINLNKIGYGRSRFFIGGSE